MQEVGCVYLAFPGGACPLLSDAIESVVSVDWPDMVSHYRLVTLKVRGLGPLTVGIDAHGRSLYDQLSAEARARLPGLLEEMREARQPAPR
jgi:fumarate hydratase subunit beta